MNRTKEFLLRTVSTLVFIPLLLFFLFSSFKLLLPLLILVVANWALFEFYNLSSKTGTKLFRFLGHICLIYLLLLPLLQFVTLRLFQPIELWLVFLIGFTIYLFQSRDNTYSFFANAGVTILGILYIGFPFSLLINLHLQNSGAWYILWLILVTWFCDIGAYTVGSSLGKNKLIPSISPGKTVEGLIGGLFFSMIIAIIAWWFMGWKYHYLQFSFGTNIIMSLVIAGVGVIGDLAESVLKRKANLKDSGNTFTGHGGMLDVIDSLLFTIPIFYLFYRLTISL